MDDCSSPLHSLGGLRGVQFLAILVVANPWGRSTVAAADAGADTEPYVSIHRCKIFCWLFSVPDNLAVDSAGDAVLELQVHLGNGVLGEDGGVGDITCNRAVLVTCSDSINVMPSQYSWFSFKDDNVAGRPCFSFAHEILLFDVGCR